MKIKLGIGPKTTTKMRANLFKLVDELYFSYTPSEWLINYGYEFPINRIGYIKDASYTDLDDVKALITEAHDANKPIYLALNAHFYLDEQIPLLTSLISKMITLGIQGFIVADLSIMSLIRTHDAKASITASIGADIYNCDHISFLQDLFQINRVVLPRYIQKADILQIKKNSNISLEAMGHTICKYDDGRCFAYHKKSERVGEQDNYMCTSMQFTNDSDYFYQADRVQKNWIQHCQYLQQLGVDTIKTTYRSEAIHQDMISFLKSLQGLRT
jgi:U32 family peptidase